MQGYSIEICKGNCCQPRIIRSIKWKILGSDTSLFSGVWNSSNQYIAFGISLLTLAFILVYFIIILAILRNGDIRASNSKKLNFDKASEGIVRKFQPKSISSGDSTLYYYSYQSLNRKNRSVRSFSNLSKSSAGIRLQ